MTDDQKPRSSSLAPVRGATLALTNLIKLAGLVLAVNEAVLRAELRPAALALAAFMMAGAQFSEGLLLSLLDQFLGRGETK